MEYTALLAGERFNDHPRCTHRALAELARQVNDRVSRDARPTLVARAPALAAVGRDRDGVAAVVVDAVVGSERQCATPDPALLRWRSRRAAGVLRRDVPGRGRWARARNLLAAHDIVYAGLVCIDHSIRDRAAKDRVLLEVLDRALAGCAPQPSIAPAGPVGDLDSPRIGSR